LHPSVGNRQKACQSHYVINGGQVKWEAKWTPSQITQDAIVRKNVRCALFADRTMERFWQWLNSFFGHSDDLTILVDVAGSDRGVMGT
jgi:hypothetical protein